MVFAKPHEAMGSKAQHGGSASAEEKKQKKADSITTKLKFTTVAMVLAGSGMVPREDMVCVCLASVYIWLMAKFVFPPVTKKAPASPFARSKLLKAYVTVAAWVGIYLPFTFCMLLLLRARGVLSLDLSHDDEALLRSAAPHTFLLCCQVVSERLVFRSDAISLPVRSLVPVLYNSGRIVSIWEWIEALFYSTSGNRKACWLWLSSALAVSNFVLWIYNLFGFLIPMVIPMYFKAYFEDLRAWNQQTS